MAKKEKKITLEQQIKQLRENIVQDLKHWQYLREYGCQDPFWADGVNMNLTRNHIIYYKMRLRELCPDGSLPEEYYLPTPPEVDNNYLAPNGKCYDVRKHRITQQGDTVTTRKQADVDLKISELF